MGWDAGLLKRVLCLSRFLFYALVWCRMPTYTSYTVDPMIGGRGYFLQSIITSSCAVLYCAVHVRSGTDRRKRVFIYSVPSEIEEGWVASRQVSTHGHGRGDEGNEGDGGRGGEGKEREASELLLVYGISSRECFGVPKKLQIFIHIPYGVEDLYIFRQLDVNLPIPVNYQLTIRRPSGAMAPLKV